jgi:hypothetical protein
LYRPGPPLSISLFLEHREDLGVLRSKPNLSENGAMRFKPPKFIGIRTSIKPQKTGDFSWIFPV